MTPTKTGEVYPLVSFFWYARIGDKKIVKGACKVKKETKQLLSIGGYMAKWLLITAIIGLFMGRYPPFFLKSLTYVTDVRLANPWLLFILPISGVVFTYFYTRFGEKC